MRKASAQALRAIEGALLFGNVAPLTFVALRPSFKVGLKHTHV